MNTPQAVDKAADVAAAAAAGAAGASWVASVNEVMTLIATFVAIIAGIASIGWHISRWRLNRAQRKQIIRGEDNDRSNGSES